MNKALILKMNDTLLAGPMGSFDAYVERVSREAASFARANG